MRVIAGPLVEAIRHAPPLGENGTDVDVACPVCQSQGVRWLGAEYDAPSWQAVVCHRGCGRVFTVVLTREAR